MVTKTSAPPAEKKTRAEHVRRLLIHAGLIAFGLVMLYPLLWMLSSSFKPTEEIFRDPSLLPGDNFMPGNYTDGWTALQHPFHHYLLNSAIVVAGSIVGNLIGCSMAAYAFARLEFFGKKLFFAVMLMTIMLPIHVVIVPQYILFAKLDWINTFYPLIVPKLLATDGFFVFLMVQFIRGLPREVFEAARIDGAGHGRIYARITLPLMVPALATTTIFTFIWTWGDFFGPLIYLRTRENFTVSVALKGFVDAQSSSNYGAMFAMSVVSLVPLFFAFLVGQRYLVKGIATTGIK